MRSDRVLRRAPLAVFGALALLGCEEGDRGSTVTGTLAGGPLTRVTGIAVAQHGGGEALADIDPDRGFAVALEGKGRYRFYLEDAAGRVPVVLRGEGGELGAELVVESGGASVDVGQLHFRPGRVGALQGVGDDGGSCPDGTTAGGAPCIRGQAVVSCNEHGDDDDDGDDEHEHEHGEAVDPSVSCSDDDGAADCAVEGAATIAPTEPAAIVELGLPVAIGCKKRKHHHHHD